METKSFETVHFIDFIQNESSRKFKDYFFNQVQLVKVEIPSDIDVAHYFEVMNNRGEQLEEHEIVKARLLDEIKDYKNESILFSKIWDACSQMNEPIQRLFNKEDRESFFGENYDSYQFKIDKTGKKKTESNGNSSLSIDDILSGESILSEKGNTKKEKEAFESIIDFPNFLMHVLKLYFKDEEDIDIPLNGDELLKWFDNLKDQIAPLEFIDWLLYYRVVFDRFVVTVVEDEKSEDYTKWVLHKPGRYYNKKEKNHRLIYKNSFEEYQESIVKCLSMLQVTFRTKKYKNYLQEILSLFFEPKDLKIKGNDFLAYLNDLVLSIYDNNTNFERLVEDPPYNEGTNTPHFLFNFIDYLYWTENKKEFNFEFKYRNSIEHHLAQSFKNSENEGIIDCLGNLCLVSKSGNSKMNNEAPEGKASVNGKYYKKGLPAKQLTMYNITNTSGQWGEVEILKHYYDVLELLDRRNEIL